MVDGGDGLAGLTGLNGLAGLAEELDARLAAVDERLRRGYPGEPAARQPVHTVYAPADRCHAGVLGEWGRAALDLLASYGGSGPGFASVFGVSDAVSEDVEARVQAKLAREPVEDLRIDFEDGYGARGDDDEDAAAVDAARMLAAWVADGTVPAFAGIRTKSLEASTRRRALRTLDLFVGTLAATGPLPEGFVMTLPKVSAVDQVGAMVRVCERLEHAYGLPTGRLRFEVQVETPQAILAGDGSATVARIVHAGAGRCTGLHYGTYDYSAACGIAAGYQSLEHPVADHAKAVMQVAAAGTGVRLSDGSTNRLPVGDRVAVQAAWAEHARLVRRSLERGFYQGWDLHPGQLVSRYAAVFAFYREGLDAAGERLAAYVARADSGYLDEPATARGLAGSLLRGLRCGALDETEVSEATGLDVDRLATLAVGR